MSDGVNLIIWIVIVNLCKSYRLNLIAVFLDTFLGNDETSEMSSKLLVRYAICGITALKKLF